MARCTVKAVALAAILLAGPTVAQTTGDPASPWTGASGGPDRSGSAMLDHSPLDVRGDFRFTNDTDQLMGWLNLIWTAQGPSHMVEQAPNAGNSCRLVRIDSIDPPRSSLGKAQTCWDRGYPSLGAYDAQTDALIFCPSSASAEQPILRARDSATEEIRWEVYPQDAGITLPSEDGALPVPPPPVGWHCANAALDSNRREVILPYHQYPLGPEQGTGRNRIVSVDVDTGEVRWSTAVPLSTFAGANGGAVPTVGEPSTHDQGFEAETITLTESGVAVMGSIYGSQRAAAWLNRDGDIIGARAAESQDRATDENPRSSQTTASEWWAASGPLAVAALGDHVLLIDPTLSTVLAQAEVDPILAGATSSPDEQGGIHPPPKWAAGTIILPLRHGVVAFDENLDRLWSWTGGPDTYVSDALITPPGDLYVLSAKEQGEDDEAWLLRLGLDDGDLRQALPLPVNANIGAFRDFEGFLTNRWWARLFPLADGSGLLAYDDRGNAVHLGTPTATPPTVALDQAYPAVGAPVTLQVDVPEAADMAWITWDQGTQAIPVNGPSATQTYNTAGIHTIHTTAVYSDGRTATTATEVHVGGSPAPGFNLFEWAFERDRQDMTFGVIGILIALLGGILAVRRRRRRHTVLGRGMDNLRAIRETGRQDPSRALLDLYGFRRQVEADLATSRLDDAQFGALELRANRLGAALQQRWLAPLEARMTRVFQDRLAAAIADQNVDAKEANDLRAALSQERRLRKADRRELEDFLAACQEDA